MPIDSVYMLLGAALLVQPLALGAPMFSPHGPQGSLYQSAWAQGQDELTDWSLTSGHSGFPSTGPAYHQPSYTLPTHPSLQPIWTQTAFPAANYDHWTSGFGGSPPLMHNRPGQNDDRVVNEIHSPATSNFESNPRRRAYPALSGLHTHSYSVPSPTPEEDEEWIRKVLRESPSPWEGSDQSRAESLSPSLDTGRHNSPEGTRELHSRLPDSSSTGWRPASTPAPAETSPKVGRASYNNAQELPYFKTLDYLDVRRRLRGRHILRQVDPSMQYHINQRVFKGEFNWVPLETVEGVKTHLRKMTPFERRHRRLPLVAVQPPEEFVQESLPVYFTDHNFNGRSATVRGTALENKAFYNFWVLPKLPGEADREVQYLGTGYLNPPWDAVDDYLREATSSAERAGGNIHL